VSDQTQRSSALPSPRGGLRAPVLCGLACLLTLGTFAALLSACGSGNAATAELDTNYVPTRAERQLEEASERRQRRADENRLESNLLADGKLLASLGALRGPMLRASCTSIGGGNSSNLSSYKGSYDCLIVNRERHVPHHGHIVEGVRFYATIDFRDGFERFGGG
jgi:hypothetical protein